MNASQFRKMWLFLGVLTCGCGSGPNPDLEVAEEHSRSIMKTLKNQGVLNEKIYLNEEQLRLEIRNEIFTAIQKRQQE